MLKVQSVRFYRHELKTRFPFRYGIASMTEVPHLFVKAEIDFAGKRSIGISADLLPPKWFTKNPDSDYETEDLPEMLSVIAHAATSAMDVGPVPSFFEWWQELYASQNLWAKEQGIASLLANFGVSLIERAVIDAICRATELTLHQLLISNRLEIDLAAIRPELQGLSPCDIVASETSKTIQLRHTIGMGDPLTDSEILDEDRVDDGLPHSLVATLRSYGLSSFKIKLSGNRDQDRERLLAISSILQDELQGPFQFTMDGNENYRDINHFRDDYEFHLSDTRLSAFFQHGLLFVEQPLHRDWSLNEDVQAALQNWPDAPPMIIDESDADLGSLPTALSLGYSGTSHKNCKGITKGLLNAATIHKTELEGRCAILSGEDLANLGPVALLQDLTMAACLGIEHVERNGHHYFAGLSIFPRQLQEQSLRNHPDLFHQMESGLIAVHPQSGHLEIDSLLKSPFGMLEHPDLSLLTEWP
ncbi:hypothetical protein [Thalassoglobus sp.]|uniref:hypothetical protein n=1 Tax=Thalassoglobus sp. TaxID=2795869 RepID=UPI003AA7D68E